MKPIRALFAGLLAIVSTAVPARADVVLLLSTGRDYLQRGAFVTDFRGGDLSVLLRDGIIVTSPCADQPSGEIVAPNLLCPLGTTGFIAAGDADGDGVRDDLSFWSITNVIPALLVEPFNPGSCRLFAAPPSKLPRPLGPFRDRGVVTFFNIFTESVQQWDITLYDFTRNYPAGPGGRSQMESEIVYGQYVFTFPRLDFPTSLVGLPVTHAPIPEAFDISAPRFVREKQLRFTTGVWDAKGNRMMDPRLTNVVTWIGIDPTNTYPAADTFRISIRDFETETDIRFPPSQTPLLLPNPFTQEYNLPPLFFEPGETAMFQLRLDRQLGSSSIAYDTSVRLFNFGISFVDSYQGFRLSAFPPGSPVGTTVSGADFDADGFSNVLEFALQSDPALAASKPVLPVAQQDVINGDENDGTVFVTVPKRPSVGGSLRYQFEISKNGGPFVLINANNARWAIEQDDDVALTIRTKADALAADYEVRVRVAEIALQ